MNHLDNGNMGMGVESSAPNLAEMLRIQVIHEGGSGSRGQADGIQSAVKYEPPRRAIYTAESSKRNHHKGGGIKISYNSSMAA